MIFYTDTTQSLYKELYCVVYNDQGMSPGEQ